MTEINNYKIHCNKYFEFEGIKHLVKPLTVKGYCELLNDNIGSSEDILKKHCPSLLELKELKNKDEKEKNLIYTILVSAVREILFSTGEDEKQVKKPKEDKKTSIDITFLISNYMNFYNSTYKEVMELDYTVFTTLYERIEAVQVARKQSWADLLVHLMPADSKDRFKNYKEKHKKYSEIMKKYISTKITGKKALDILKKM